MPTPLTSVQPNGAPYERPPEIETAIDRVLAMNREDVIAASRIRNPLDANYIPSECLVHLLRQTRSDNREVYFQQLYMAVMDRIDRALPRIARALGEKVAVDLNRATIRDQVRDRFEDILVDDRNTPGGRLDFFEIRFAAAVRRLRSTARTKAWREAGRTTALDDLAPGGELPVEVERSAGGLDMPEKEMWDDPRYRPRLDAAIDNLPPEQSRIITMLRAEIPIDSDDPSVVTIRSSIGCAEKTVRNRRDAAIVLLRRAMGLEDDQ